ncbi:MAG: NADH-quinone oxidoreductase subunit L [Phycisphaeraceae bacterium]|nr:NADH-quinone oxidoreductase subunit L [Phycisphaeraceae bacterium]
MTSLQSIVGPLLAMADTPAAAAEYVAPGAGPAYALLVPVLPLIAFVLCALCAAMRVKSKLPAWITVGLLACSFGVTLAATMAVRAGGPMISHGFEWINFSWGDGPGQAFVADFSLYLDSLTCLWMLFVTGLATLIALYASEYMSHDVGQGYNRFFAAFSLFVFSMACLVMADNLVLLYLGWEGVGLCSYLLIGYFYKKPSAVAAAKKAFIVNRIGDLFLALGIMLCFVHFGSVEYKTIFEQARPYVELLTQGRIAEIPAIAQIIPLLLMVGAFGKSAQLPLYVWLPDAMEGPTPVSALIHAATMVTAGVFLIARAYPLFLISESALPIVGWVGALTALLAATIGMAQFDIKRIMAYSTVSQLGYMFAGLAVLGSTAAAAHVFTHAFFKAMLFLSCGAVMHGFAGQLDLRKLSGVGSMPGWRIVGIAMLIGCLNLAGFPVITAGFWSKDMILGDAFANPSLQAIGWILLLTAGLTAYYTFRVYFRVFVGPQQYEMGDEHHGTHDDAHAHGDHHGGHGHVPGHGGGHDKHDDHHDHHDTPHAPGWAINTVLAVLAVASFAILIPLKSGPDAGWVGTMVSGSSARTIGDAAYLHSAHGAGHTHATFFGFDAHKAMLVVSSIVGLVGIGVAYWLHRAGRTTAATARADALLPAAGPLARWAQNKWYVDELYDAIVRKPLLILSHLFHVIDRYLVDGLVDLLGWAPRGAGRTLRPSQSGQLHGYALGMAGGIVAFLVIVLLVIT